MEWLEGQGSISPGSSAGATRVGYARQGHVAPDQRWAVTVFMLIPLIVLSVMACVGLLLIPASLREGDRRGRHARGVLLASSGHGVLAGGISGIAFLIGSWFLFFSIHASGLATHVFRDLAIALYLVSAVFFLCAMSIRTFGRPRVLIPAAFREGPPQALGQPTIHAGQADGTEEPGTGSMLGRPYQGDLAGEVEYTKFVANMFQHGRPFGGRVTVTDRRLTFVPVAPSRANGGQDWEIGLEQVLAAGLAPRSMKVSEGLGRRRLRIRTHAGGNVYFVVWNVRQKAALINRAREGRVSGKEVKS